MAKKTAKRTTRKKAGRAAKPKMDFHGQMVLFRWALGHFGLRDLREFKERFQLTPDTPGGIDERTGLHRFYEIIAGALPTVGDGDVLALDTLQAYEQNILEHTRTINTARAQHSQPAIEWKYHQYLALIFTEIFLDRYFHDAAALRDELNGVIAEHNDSLGDASHPDWVRPYPTQPTGEDDGDPKNQLSRLAFWCATGSGKTLLMHAHIHQFKWYHERAYKAGTWPALDQIILVTPSDGLSDQHAEELTWAGFDVVSVGEAGVDGLFAQQARKAVKILSIHKFREDHGQSTVATEAFQGCNLVLVDEGHRGAGSGSDGAWLTRRNQLAEGGFTFEYSATFKEAVQGDEDMRPQYARSILFDYAYRSFYRDGYGKDFTILNLEKDDQQTRYLTAALLLFYQQMRVWMDGGERIKPFQIDKPLWVFVGHTVTGGKASTKDDKVSVSDVVEVLLFVKQFLADPAAAIGLIRSLLDEGMIDQQGRDLLANRLPHLDLAGDPDALARSLHAGILRDIFHAPGGGVLTVQLFREAAGELALKVGEGEPFGVVNVGDPVAVADACEKAGVTRLEDDTNRSSLFKGINREDSTINLLVGSRKFTEGWNSWRVSSIGLMNMGKGEGTQIIQLFGRGVRLRGYGMSLRRSSVLGPTPPKPKNLQQVETLQVFGIKATYMNRFRDWILSEVPEAAEKQVWELPVYERLPENRRLKTLDLQDEIEGVKVERGTAFRKLGPLVRLRPPDETGRADHWLREHPTRLNWLPKIRALEGKDRQVGGEIGERQDLPEQKLTQVPLWFFDLDAILFGLEAHKAARGLDRLHADRHAIEALLRTDHWYTLHATRDDMRLDRYENRAQWQRMAELLVNGYAERFYNFVRSRWEAPYIQVVDVTPDDVPDQILIESGGEIQTEEDVERLAEVIQNLKAAIEADCLAPWTSGTNWGTVPFGGHLYQPVLWAGRNAQIRMSPVALNGDEQRFVEHLARWCAANTEHEVYLLRNEAVHGLGFFQASNYFPDFLMWVCTEDTQHLAFVDPKGLKMLNQADPKIQFALQDVPDIQRVVDRQDASLRLHSFIYCRTPYSGLDWPGGNGERMSQEEVERHNVIFMTEDETDISQLMERILASSGQTSVTR